MVCFGNKNERSVCYHFFRVSMPDTRATIQIKKKLNWRAAGGANFIKCQKSQFFGNNVLKIIKKS